ncbi:uncharacterized protein LOC107481939 [Arachis duranensis]|uniref:VQ domain-containing protein n=2 Tax=Arachis TaxID=3817 RepID=A0A444ZSP5_ARAHY|nr:uncharacterized protein LOC107481939 [Arachis duranensis]XP_025682785.1 uncharacterized protein LOC112783916 [Arachis hypogaea]QHO04036.1 uncharacterized protein DS421_13g437190 [Arachis hypogaea]RYR17114.1 hypothetical protein Ahy_B03g061907 [Arachis hypogaea]
MMNNNGRSSGSSVAPKIVQIETRYVETDPINFRQVVQSLTGKNSSMPIVTPSPLYFTEREQEEEAIMAYRHGSIGAKKPQEQVAVNHHAATIILNNNVSFKDFDALLSDLPSIHDLLY